MPWESERLALQS